jgi:hypothetical protein
VVTTDRCFTQKAAALSANIRLGCQILPGTNTLAYLLSYLETSGGQSSNLCLNVVPFLTPALIRHMWQLKTVVFLHWCLIRTVLLVLKCKLNVR